MVKYTASCFTAYEFCERNSAFNSEHNPECSTECNCEMCCNKRQNCLRKLVVSGYVQIGEGYHQPLAADVIKINLDAGITALALIIQHHTVAKLVVGDALA